MGETSKANEQNIVLAAGCFWCVEAVFKELGGVLAVTPGYAGDSAETANYEAVCSKTTNHAEVVRVVYDPQQIALADILKVFFFVAHDPTQLNRQGEDVGRQYRSAIFYANDGQKRIAEAYINQLNNEKAFASPVVTTVEPLTAFFEAEDYHHDYARLHPEQPYIVCTAQPKVAKLRKLFTDKLKA